MIKKWASWFKGALDGLIIAFIISGGLVSSNYIWNKLASPGYITCAGLTQCSGDICQGCTVIGLMINLFYGFVIGAIIGWIIGKIIGEGKNQKINRRKKR